MRNKSLHARLCMLSLSIQVLAILWLAVVYPQRLYSSI